MGNYLVDRLFMGLDGRKKEQFLLVMIAKDYFYGIWESTRRRVPIGLDEVKKGLYRWKGKKLVFDQQGLT